MDTLKSLLSGLGWVAGVFVLVGVMIAAVMFGGIYFDLVGAVIGWVVGMASTTALALLGINRRRVAQAAADALNVDAQKGAATAPPENVRDPSSGSPVERDKELLREPPRGAEGLSLFCRSCGEEIVVYYLNAGEQAKCGACGGHTEVPDGASTTNKPSTLAQAYGYGDGDPDGLRTLPQPAKRPDDKQRLPQATDGNDAEAAQAKKKLPRKSKEPT